MEGIMKQRFPGRRLQTERPVWCDHCRLRIAPYEDVTIASARKFHKHCFRKVEITESPEGNLDRPGLDLAIV
jgi:hypothetical protein